MMQCKKPGAHWRLVIRSDNRPVWITFNSDGDGDGDGDGNGDGDGDSLSN